MEVLKTFKTFKMIRPLHFYSHKWILLFICFVGACHADCSIKNPDTAPLGSTTFSSANTLRATASSIKFKYSFLITCSANSNYAMTLESIDKQNPGILSITNPQGDKIAVTAKLKSVGGHPIDTDFSKMPGGSYSGSIAATQKQEVIVELTPVNVVLSKGRAAGGLYIGNAIINLVY